MAENRSEQRPRLAEAGAPALGAEVLRLAAASAKGGDPAKPDKPAKPDERTPWFWHVFGTTLLSIAALVAVTLYQQLSSGLNEVRADLKAFGEGSGDLVKKDELAARSAALSGSVKELQAGNAAALDLWRERAALLDRQIQSNADESRQQIKELTRELQRLRERLAVVESRQPGGPTDADAAGKK